ncbi:Adenylyl-sulfate kinase [Bienertia sinuspersici]
MSSIISTYFLVIFMFFIRFFKVLIHIKFRQIITQCIQELLQIMPCNFIFRFNIF